MHSPEKLQLLENNYQNALIVEHVKFDFLDAIE
jgi:hypothetical protein